MNISLTKVEITKNILKTESEVVLKHIKTILQNELSETQKKSVKKAQLELAARSGKPHKEVMKNGL